MNVSPPSVSSLTHSPSKQESVSPVDSQRRSPRSPQEQERFENLLGEERELRASRQCIKGALRRLESLRIGDQAAGTKVLNAIGDAMQELEQLSSGARGGSISGIINDRDIKWQMAQMLTPEEAKLADEIGGRVRKTCGDLQNLLCAMTKRSRSTESELCEMARNSFETSDESAVPSPRAGAAADRLGPLLDELSLNADSSPR